MLNFNPPNENFFKSNLAQSLLPVDLPVLTAMEAVVPVQEMHHTT
jgi:hypothetical protein